MQEKEKVYVNMNGRTEEFSPESGESRSVRFPVCLAVEHEQEVKEVCSDFMFSADHERILVKSRNPLPEGSTVLIHIYVPPEEKLLGRFHGEVEETMEGDSTEGRMKIRLLHHPEDEMQRFQEFLEEKKHLVDFAV